jgi:hypothetical protein
VACGVPLVRAGDAPTTQPTTAPTDRNSISKWLVDLASSDSAVRDAAKVHLMHLSRGDLPMLEQLLRRSRPLAPAQAVVLRQIVQEAYLSGEPYVKDPTNSGFLGIAMDGVLGQQDLQQPNDNGQAPGIVVADRFAGFCASRMLRQGDVILGTAKPPQVFTTITDLQNAVRGAEPGSMIHLLILRQGQIIQIPLTLDCRPAELGNSPENFRRERAEKFDDYWHETFAPLLKDSVG